MHYGWSPHKAQLQTTSSKAHMWNSILKPGLQHICSESNTIHPLGKATLSPHPRLASTTPKYTSASDVVTPAQNNNEGDNEPQPNILDIPIPPPLAPGPLPTRREMTQVTVNLGGSLQKGLQLIYPMDPVRIMHYFSEILTTCPSNFASIKMLTKPKFPVTCPTALNLISPLWKAK